MGKVKAKAVIKKTVKKETKQVKKVSPKKSVVKRVHEGEMVVYSPINPGQSFVVASEMADDEAIEAELTGKAMESYVYSFKEGGKTVTGLTVSGVNEMARMLTRKKDSGIKIRVVPDSVKITRDVDMGGEKGIEVILIAENMLTGETAIGAKFEPYKKTGGKNGSYTNTFALEKAVSKAERNAKRKLIPEKVAIEMVKKFIQNGGVKELSAPQPVGNDYNPRPQTNSVSSVDYLSKLITMIAKECGIKIEKGVNISVADGKKMIEKYNFLTGHNVKTFRVSQEVAKEMLFALVNCPLLTNR